VLCYRIFKSNIPASPGKDLKLKTHRLAQILSILILVTFASCAPARITEVQNIKNSYVCPLDYDQIIWNLNLKEEDVSDKEIREYYEAFCHMDLTATLTKAGLADIDELLDAQEAYLKSYDLVIPKSTSPGFNSFDKMPNRDILLLWVSAIAMAQQVPDQITLVKTESHCDGDEKTPPCTLWREYEYVASNGSHIFISTLELGDGTIVGVFVIQAFDTSYVARNCDTSVINNPEGIYGCPLTWSTLHFKDGHYVNLYENGLVMLDSSRYP